MNTDKQRDTEAIQRIVAKHVATHPAGLNLALIGGFRYRFLDGSARVSDDIDYHWAGDLAEKQEELLVSFRRGLISEVSSRLGYSGRCEACSGPDAESPLIRIVELSFWKDGVAYSRIEIPVEVTRIACADPIEVRTAAGTVYATPSDGDMIESKIIAMLGRITLRHRDIVDVFLFQDQLTPDSSKRLRSKLDALALNNARIEERLRDMRQNCAYHLRAIQEIIESQLDRQAAVQINSSGGGRIVLDAVLKILDRHLATEFNDERA